MKHCKHYNIWLQDSLLNCIFSKKKKKVYVKCPKKSKAVFMCKSLGPLTLSKITKAMTMFLILVDQNKFD